MATDCTPFGAFKILKDKEWHSDTEIRAACGPSGTGAVRKLRMHRYGKLGIEVAKREELLTMSVRHTPEGKYYYRIIGDIPDDVVSALTARVSFIDDPMLRYRTVRLTGNDLVYLMAVLENDPELNDPKINVLWLERRVVISNELRRHLPREIRRPSDLE